MYRGRYKATSAVNKAPAVSLVLARLLHLDAVQGRSEQRTKLYIKYSEGVAQLLTQQCAKSANSRQAMPGLNWRGAIAGGGFFDVGGKYE